MLFGVLGPHQGARIAVLEEGGT